MPEIPAPPAGAGPDFLKQYAVFAAFGYAIFQVQLFERSLALTVLMSEHADRYDRRTEQSLTQKAFLRRMNASLKRTTHLLNRASASEVRTDLAPHVDEQLLTEIEPLIEWRDFVAHRYLAVRITEGPNVAVTPDHHGELYDLAEMFQGVTAKLGALTNEIVARLAAQQAERGAGGVPEPVRIAIQDAVHAIGSAQPQRFRAPTSSGRASQDD